MPYSDLHKRKKKKNLVILLALAAWIALIWVVTMIKMGS